MFNITTSCSTSSQSKREDVLHDAISADAALADAGATEAVPADTNVVAPVEEYQPGDLVPAAYLAKVDTAQFFQNLAIPDTIFELMQGKTFKSNCTVARDDLRYLLCLHCDKDGQTFVGEMVVATRIADDVLDILQKLYKASYPIERMRLPDYWDADDERLMTDNNSSSFNFRFISHTTIVSKHGLGMAVDINPLYNPYHKTLKNGKEVIEPAIGKPYLDRSQDFDYKITKDDLCCRLFKEKGFSWGGDWPDRKDYQHFEK